jgi:hypothetical protein
MPRLEAGRKPWRFCNYERLMYCMNERLRSALTDEQRVRDDQEG